MTLFDRMRGSPLARPLEGRDYRLLVFGAVVSLLGDGFFFVALAWQVYDISNVPTALSFVGVAWTLPMIVFVLIGGAFSDRYDRRRLMIGGDIVRGTAIGLMAVLSLTGQIQLWHLAALIVFVGVGDAFFNPAFTAMVPDLVPEVHLPAANALTGVYRPLVTQLIGPAIGGLTVAALGAGAAFGVDGLTFVVSAVAIFAIRTRPPKRTAPPPPISRTFVEIREGLAFVRSNPWIWATLLSAMMSLLVFLGPMEVLVPFIVKNRLGLGPEALGLIFAAGGVGSILMSLVIGNRGQPRRRITAMFGWWSIAVATIAAYGLITALWQALIVGFIVAALFELGQMIWITLLQQEVPRELLGRVSSLDWMISTGLVPVSFALTGPVAELLGPERTMIGAAILGALLMSSLLFVPGVRDPERRPTPAAPPEAEAA
jgi:DHA3 family tetracycline resistance protein-like MFS transporter